MVAKALVLAAVSAGVQIIGGISQARSIRDAAEFEAQQLQTQKDLSQLEALQAENNERKELLIALGTQQAQAAGAGSGLGGGSFSAIQRDTRQKSTKTINNIRLMGQIKAKQFTLGIEQTLDAGESQANSAIFSALSSAAGTGVSLAGTGAFSGSGGGSSVPIPGKKPSTFTNSSGTFKTS